MLIKLSHLGVSNRSELLEPVKVIFVNEFNVSQAMSRLEPVFPSCLDCVQSLTSCRISDRVDQKVESFARLVDVLQLLHVLRQPVGQQHKILLIYIMD